VRIFQQHFHGWRRSNNIVSNNCTFWKNSGGKKKEKRGTEIFLQQVWQQRNKAVDVEIIVDFLVAVHLLFFLYAIYVLFQMYKREVGYFRFTMFFSFVAATGFAVVSFLQTMGLNIASRGMTESKGFSEIPYGFGYIALTITAAVGQSLSWWMYAADTVAMASGLMMIYWLNKKSSGNDQQRLSVKLCYFGVAIAVLCYLQFLFEIILALSDVFSHGIGVSFVILRVLIFLILMPIWTVWLGLQLKEKDIPEDSDASTQSLLSPDNK